MDLAPVVGSGREGEKAVEGECERERMGGKQSRGEVGGRKGTDPRPSPPVLDLPMMEPCICNGGAAKPWKR